MSTYSTDDPFSKNGERGGLRVRRGDDRTGKPTHWLCAALRLYERVFEKRRPALLDSLFQSLVLAPLFVWMELLFACGYRPGLLTDVRRRVEARVEAMDEGKKERKME